MKKEIKISVNVDAEEAIKALDAVCVKIDDTIKKANQLKAITADLPKDSKMNVDEIIEHLRYHKFMILSRSDFVTIKEVKEWLGRGRFIDEEINILLAERDRLFEQATKITKAPKIDNVTEGGGNATERIMIKYTNCTTKIDMRVNELHRVKEEIEAVINKVEDNKLRNLLRCRYISCRTWEDTAYAMGLSYVHVVHRLHPKALCEVQKILKKSF